MLRNFLFLMIATWCVSVFAAQSVDTTVPTNKGEWIGAYVASDDGSSILSVNNAKTRQSRLMRVSSEGVTVIATLAGITVNHMMPLADGKYEIGGGTGTDYVKRVITLGNGAPVTTWDSSKLTNRGASVSISPDGSKWVAMIGHGPAIMELQFGDTSSYKPSLSIRLSSASVIPRNAARFTADGEGVQYLRTNPDAVAVVWRGMVYVVQPGGSEPMTTLLSTGEGAGRIKWNGVGDTLWVEGATGWFAFENATAAETVQKHAFKTPIKELRHKFSNGQNGDLFPLKGGGYAVTADAGAKRTLHIEQNGRGADKDLSQLKARSAVVQVSPSGNYVLMLPEGVTNGHVMVVPVS